jgi:hypothetical protein
MHRIAPCSPMHGTLCFVFHTCTFVLDPTKPELEEPHESAPAEETNPEQEKGKP